jgi:hypothetical protein
MAKREQYQLPDSLRFLSIVISPVSVAALVNARGGTRIAVPKRADAGHWLCDLVGLDDYTKLCAHFGGCTLDLPRCVGLSQLVDDLAILADKRSGLTLTELALKYTMTERGVSKALRRIERHELQQIREGKPMQMQTDLVDLLLV